jgi:hypothetical protein
MNLIEQKNLKLSFGAALAQLASLDSTKEATLPLRLFVAVCTGESNYTIGCNSNQIHCSALSFCEEATTSSQENPKAGAGAELGQAGPSISQSQLQKL